ncbi:hypothetical protein A3E42_04875 [Candidatus Gottesmanbacteria bacterium RIFCSPHIGHO2_12_FULL_40_13]|nr:MAG: hypothetical protein A3E42_04875 [Candidatus Gottesmanbacteria bacterium RIFCSPHIGHO2_12_FULL_40_13]OGG32643.1 MAG: hypothetical protein A3I80_06370 [Candidatus Gottesmanbacteria bacterium RIFCSPLOWO2_02_FULL_40_10]
MSGSNFNKLLYQEIKRIDKIKVTKRKEKIISGFSATPSPKANIGGKYYHVFNSNDYLGLRLHPQLLKAERNTSEKFGTGPGAVRFISGTLEVHRQLESAVARFHQRDDAIVFSSAFAANLAAIFCFIKGQSKDTNLGELPLVISDELNHRSIIDGIRLSGLPGENKLVYRHLDYDHLKDILNNGRKKYKRAIVITDGIFSMLGEYPDLKKMRRIIDLYDSKYDLGVLFLVDDSHGVGAVGNNGRGVEEITGAGADLLVGTFGKAFGSDGGYVAGNRIFIDYLRESSATYIYSNSITPGTAAAALCAVKLLDRPAGKKLLRKLENNIRYFRKICLKQGLQFASDSVHPIQPLLIGDPLKARKLVDKLFDNYILTTNISYPVVPKGHDEIRIQLSAVHDRKDIDRLVKFLSLNK